MATRSVSRQGFMASLLSCLAVTQLSACGRAPTMAAPVSAAAITPAGTGGSAPTQYLTTPAGRIAYDDVGTGPVVLCVPGLGDLRQEYRFLTPRLVAAGYRVVTMDVRGMGESGTDWQDYSVAGVGADMLALARHLQAGPVSLIGTSMAAGAGVWAAAEGPDLVNGLVAIGPFVRSTDPAWKSRLIASLFSGFWGAGLWVSYFETLFPTAKPADFKAYREALKRNLSEDGRLTSVREMMAAAKDAAEQRLDQVRVPVLTLMGTKDPDFADPAAEARLVADRLRGELHMIDGAGHYPHAEMPQQTAPLITDFLKGLRTEVQHGS